MTSAIDESVINAAYPVAGQDNDTQGFRDNFGNIQTALGVAKTEITDLQNNSVLKATVDGNNDPVVNNMGGSTISNGILRGMAQEVVLDSNNLDGATQQINVSTASFYYLTNVAGNMTLQFNAGWPTWATAGDPALVSVRVMLKPSSGLASNPIITVAAGANSITCDSSTSWTASPTTFTLNYTTLKAKLIEVFSMDGGLNVFVRYLGEY